jgi:hypothetical protein
LPAIFLCLQFCRKLTSRQSELWFENIISIAQCQSPAFRWASSIYSIHINSGHCKEFKRLPVLSILLYCSSRCYKTTVPGSAQSEHSRPQVWFRVWGFGRAWAPVYFPVEGQRELICKKLCVVLKFVFGRSSEVAFKRYATFTPLQVICHHILQWMT